MWTRHRPRSTPSSWTKAPTWRRCRRRTGCCATTTRCTSGAGRPPTRAAKKPELLAARPNEAYSWDVTKLLGPVKWTWFYLYVILDIYSRYVPGWMLAHAENARLAEVLLADTAARQGIACGQLTIHADRGSPMTAKPVALLLAELG